MPFCETPNGALYYTVTDASAPWNLTHRETIIFCHGVATNADIWAAWLPILVQHYRIVRFDTRGFGRSAMPPNGFEWTLAGLGDDILAIADVTGVARFHLVGESAGGTACLALAAREGAGGRVRSLTVLSTGHVGGYIRNVDPWRPLIEAEGMGTWSRQMMEHRFAPGALDSQRWAWFHDVQSRTEPEALLGAADMLLASDLRPVLDQVTMPALVLSGSASPFVPLAAALDLVARLPDGRLRVFPHARHGLPFSHAVPASAILLGFLERLRGS